MSWAAHNPEKYTEIMNNGIKHKLREFLPDERQGDEAFWADIDYMLSELQSPKGQKVYDALAYISNAEIIEAESDYFSSFVK